MKTKRVEIDSGEGINNLDFDLEKKIRGYREGIDYEVDKTGNFYTILSEELKKVIWPNDYFCYNESVVAIDRKGKIEGWRMQADNPREPYEKVVKGGLQEIMNDFDKKERIPNYQRSQEIKESESDSHFLEKDTKESSKKDLIFWVVGISLLLSIPLLFYLKKRLICQRKSKKSYESKQ